MIFDCSTVANWLLGGKSSNTSIITLRVFPAIEDEMLGLLYCAVSAPRSLVRAGLVEHL
jgi:hypothetical protein